MGIGRILPALRGLTLLVALVAASGTAAAAAATHTSGAGERGTAAEREAGVAVVGDGVAAADPNDFRFDSLHVDYELGRDEDGAATLSVTETFVAAFPESDQNHGMQRSLPTDYLGAPLNPTLVSVTDDDGEPRPVETDEDDGRLVITSAEDDYVHGRQTYVFTYTMENVTRNFSDTGSDEFYWDVNGEEWSQPFREVSATVTVPGKLAEAFTGDAACYAGASGSNDRCEIAGTPGEDGDLVFKAGGVPLDAFGVMTVAIGFASGTFTPFDSSFLGSPWGIAQGVATVPGVLSLVWAILWRRRRLRDAPGRPTVIAEYEPPEGVDALGAALLLSRNQKAVSAELLEQAIGGSLRIEEVRDRRGKPVYEAELVDPWLADDNGRTVLQGMFPTMTPGERFRFGKSSSRFGKSMQAAMEQTKAALAPLYREVPKPTRVLPFTVGLIASLAMIGFGIVALISHVSQLVPLLLMGAGLLIILLIFAVLSKRPLSERGADVRDHLSGLKTFIGWAEADRIRMLQSPEGAQRRPVDTADAGAMVVLYERLLPFAVVFGQEKRWSEQLAVYYGDHSPGWYHGDGGFNPAAFAGSMSSLSSSTSSTASSSGGSTGGGSAGGGGGGGGGGGV